MSVPVERIKLEQVDKAEAALLSLRRLLDQGADPQSEGMVVFIFHTLISLEVMGVSMATCTLAVCGEEPMSWLAGLWSHELLESFITLQQKAVYDGSTSSSVSQSDMLGDNTTCTCVHLLTIVIVAQVDLIPTKCMIGTVGESGLYSYMYNYCTLLAYASL